MRLRTVLSIGCAVIAGATLGTSNASADPVNNPNAVSGTAVCPGVGSFEFVAVGAVAFVQNRRLIGIAYAPGQGSLDLVPCTVTSGGQTFTLFARFVERG
jgi:hypothetical protein